MKNFISIFLFWMLSLLYTSSEAQQRHVFWVHGYQGNDVGWRPVEDDVESRFEVINFAPSYNASQESLDAASDHLEDKIRVVAQNREDSDQNFIIAHSQGGLVAREMGVLTDEDGSLLFDGLITFGTPHQGVFAANTLVDNPEMVEDVITNACSSLGLGPALDQVNQNFFLGLLIGFGFADDIFDDICDIAGPTVFDVVFAFAEQGIESELTTDAISGLAPMATQHNAVFYGREDGYDLVNGDVDGSLTPRFFGALLPGSIPTDYDVYEAGASDEVGLGLFTQLQDDYLMRWNYYRGRRCNRFEKIFGAVVGGIVGTATGPLGTIIGASTGSDVLFSCDEIDEMIDAYRRGVDWFPTFDPSWRELIGSTSFEVTQQRGCYCSLVVESPPDETNPEDIIDPSGPNFAIVESAEADCEYIGEVFPGFSHCITLFETFWEHTPSDGFILEESATNAPGMNYPLQFMGGSNHMQMRNDANTANAIQTIFSDSFGEGAAGYFYSE